MRSALRRVEAHPRVVFWTVQAVAALLVLMSLGAFHEMRYVDELSHYDYVVKMAHGNVVHRGDRVGAVAMREQSCRGIDVDARLYRILNGQEKDIPTCDEPALDPSRFPERGYNLAYVQPPTYYAVVAPVARVLRAVTGGESMLTPARSLGVVWLCGALAVLWLLLAELGVGVAARGATLLFLAALPGVLMLVVSVTNDAPTVLLSAAFLLAVIRWDRKRAPAWLPVLVAAICMAVKITNAVALAAGVAYLLFRVTRGRAESSRTMREVLTLIGMIAVAAAVPAVVWSASLERIAHAPRLGVPFNARTHILRLPSTLVFGQVPAGITPLSPGAVPGFLAGPASTVLTAVAGVAVGAAALAALASPRGSDAESLGVVAAAGMPLVGPLFVITNFVLLQIFIWIPSRYAMGLAGVLAALLGLLAARPRLTPIAGALGVAAPVYVLVAAARALS